MYPGEFRSSIEKVEATRQRRMNEKLARLTADERAALLKQYHPDFREGAMAELRYGPNKGEAVPRELADLLEGTPRVEPGAGSSAKEFHLEADVLVLGGGGAGATAALMAHDIGAKVVLATKLRFGDSNTVMAEGGIAAATRPDDSPARHFLDTMGGGRFENKRELVAALCRDAPLIVEWLRDLGVMFDTNPDGSLFVSYAGGHSRKRVHSCKDLSGMEMMRVLRDEVLSREVRVLEFHPAVELLSDPTGKCAGAVLYSLDTCQYLNVKAKAVVLATGGIGRLHIQGFPTTNHYGATADGLVMAYRLGARLIHMDSIQYHPTGAIWPDQMFGQLITEALRGNGAQLVNAHGERFINELETRDVTSSAIIRECLERGNGVKVPTGHVGVWLDIPIIDMIGGSGKIERLFSGILRRFLKYGIDVRKEPLLVFPTQHYQNGGVEIDEWGRTSVPGLYAAGEVAGGVQGRNRLGGNSLVDIFVFGRRAGIAAAEYARSARIGPPGLEHLRRYFQEVGRPRDERAPLVLPNYARKLKGGDLEIGRVAADGGSVLGRDRGEFSR